MVICSRWHLDQGLRYSLSERMSRIFGALILTGLGIRADLVCWRNCLGNSLTILVLDTGVYMYVFVPDVHLNPWYVRTCM
jgi:hypothetical protein